MPKEGDKQPNAAKTSNEKQNGLHTENRKPSTITLVRSRMLYARAALNAKGGVRFGMRHIRTKPDCECLSQMLTARHRCLESLPRPKR